MKGIRQIHAVKCTTEQGKVLNETDPAIALTVCWKLATCVPIQSGLMTGRSSKIEREASPATTRSTDNTVVMTTDTAVKIAELAVEGSVVAVAADDDASYDYYLLKVKSNGVEELADNTTDEYGSIYTAGQEVLRGHFFLRENLIDMTYKLDERKVAIVHAATVLTFTL